MRRRSFLELLAAGSLAGTTAFAQEIIPPQPQLILLTIAGINGTTNAGRLGQVLSDMVVLGVPVNLVVETGPSAKSLRPESEISLLLARYAESFPGLVEIVAWAPDLGQLAPYQAARAAQIARNALFDAIYPAARQPSNGRPLVTLACKAPLDSKAASAVLSAGIRCVLAVPGPSRDMDPPPVETIEARLDKLGVLTLLGGAVTRLRDVAALLSKSAAGRQRHLVIPASDIDATATETLMATTQTIGKALKQATLDLSMVTVLASDVQVNTHVGFRRRIAVHVLMPSPSALPEETHAFDALLKVLGPERIPFSYGQAPAGLTGEGDKNFSYWVPLDMPADRDFDPDLPFASFAEPALHPAKADALVEQDLRFGVVVLPSITAAAGLAPDATLGLPLLAALGPREAGALPDTLSNKPLGDGLILIRAASFTTPALRAALIVQLRKALHQPDIRLMSLAAYSAEVLPKDPLLPMLLLARSKTLRQGLARPSPSSTEREALLEDAKSAWNFFDNGTVKATGLCAATMVSETRPKAAHTAVSMWEVGSHINALIAAVDLAIIEDEEFTARIKPLIRTVERGSRKRLVLPPETIDTYSGKATTRFNSYDTGRLLVALYRLKTHRLAPKGLDDLVASWDFGKVVLDRRLHSYRQQKMVDDFASNYTDYVATGARLWGLDVASPMDDVDALRTADDQAKLLAASLSFGLLAVEPSYLHLLEIGSAPVPEFLADCIDLLQQRLALQSGTPAAPSESPIDRAPWFTYQGFDIRDISAPWSIQVNADEAAAIGPDELKPLQATSAKAAYMWHALRPNKHSDLLLKSVRSKGRKNFGFDSALYFKTQTSTSGYTDLNTNGIILEAIAHMLSQH